MHESDPHYMPSALLSRSIAKYNENLVDLKKFLHAETSVCEVNTEQIFNQSFAQVKRVVEPTVVTVRCSGSDASIASKQQITQGLIDQGFTVLNVRSLVEQEVERHTESGVKIAESIQNG